MRHLLTAPLSRRARKGEVYRRATTAVHSPVMTVVARPATAAEPRRVTTEGAQTTAEVPVITEVASSGTAATRPSAIAMDRGVQGRRVNHNPTVRWRKPGHRR